MDASGSTWKYVQTCVGCSVSCTKRATTASEARSTLSAQIWDSNTIGNKSKQCSLEKKLILEPEQEVQKMSMEHLVLPGDKEVCRKQQCWGCITETQEAAGRAPKTKARTI